MLSREELERDLKRFKNPILYPGSCFLLSGIATLMTALNDHWAWPRRVGAAVVMILCFYFYYRIVAVFGERRDD